MRDNPEGNELNVPPGIEGDKRVIPPHFQLPAVQKPDIEGDQPPPGITRSGNGAVDDTDCEECPTVRLERVDDIDFEERPTLPLMVVKGIMAWQNQRMPVKEPQPSRPARGPAFSSSIHTSRLDEDDEFDARPTIPLMVLTGIAARQGQPAPVLNSEISGSASNAAYVGLGNIMGTVLKYGISLLIQRGFGAAVFGLYTLSLSLVSLFSSMFTLGLDDAVVRYVSIYRSKDQPASLRGLVIFCSLIAGAAGVVGALCMIFFAPLLAALKHSTSTQLPQILQLMAPIIPLQCMESIWTSGLAGFKDFRWRVLAEKLTLPVLLIFSLLLLILFFRATGLLGITLVVFVNEVLSLLLALWFFIDKISRFVRLEHERYEMRQWLGFAVPNFLTNTTDLVLDSVDTVLLTLFISDVALGQYAAALKVSGFIGMPLAALNTMFAPTIAELHARGETAKLAEMFKVVTKWAITFSLPIFGVATLFSSSILAISGPAFVAAWPLLIAFSLGNMTNVGTGSVGYMLMMTGHQKASFFNSLTAFVLNLGLGLILAPRYGAMGVAIATGTALAVVNLLRLLQVRVLLKMQPYRRDTLKPILAWLISSLLIGSILYALHEVHFTIRILHKVVPFQLGLIPVFLACYIGLLFLFGTAPEDAVVLNAMRKKIAKLGKRKKR
ncbi:MAG TPA: oligosaccharide flippase family protein [Ktedonobacteraceae bacterium]|nr:oligosaccharide flippase family protein [Ktedonobacteraceae bacterium]